MVEITERATQAIHRIRAERHVPGEQGVRLAPDGAGSLSLVFDTPHAEDVVFRDGEEPTLIVDRNVAGHLATMVLDYQDDARRGGPGFTLRRGTARDGGGARA